MSFVFCLKVFIPNISFASRGYQTMRTLWFLYLFCLRVHSHSKSFDSFVLYFFPTCMHYQTQEFPSNVFCLLS
ncbi:hypothetical protein CARUB_v10006170mg [Capsella rubella]|uniref:Uncharacterized protein n=1 Tax=Capsella rubella TaxID=81985 RepID=R0F7B4_9BRAS|nr:hypothetical protein CARUB_v10006170mg [Capsella rubella]